MRGLDAPRTRTDLPAALISHSHREGNVPASRSRTENWRDCLAKIQDRGGALEISIARTPVWVPGVTPEPLEPTSDVVWRVRVITVRPDGVLVEAPGAFGQTISIRPGVALVGAMTVGQNRWMFHSKVIAQQNDTRGIAQLLLALPDGVERCTRRSFYRISSANLELPDIQCWPLLDPTSVVAAEAANRSQIKDAIAARQGAPVPAPSTPDEPILLPDVGPMFHAKLLNISGGGLGIRVTAAEAAAAQRRPHIWLRLDLRPHIPIPVAVTARVAHTHIDSMQELHTGLAFDFSFNAEHRRFVVDLFAKYMQQIESGQLTRAKAG